MLVPVKKVQASKMNVSLFHFALLKLNGPSAAHGHVMPRGTSEGKRFHSNNRDQRFEVEVEGKGVIMYVKE